MALRIGMFPRPQRMSSPGTGTRMAGLIMENIQAGKQRQHELQRLKDEYQRKLKLEGVKHANEMELERTKGELDLGAMRTALWKAYQAWEEGNIEVYNKYMKQYEEIGKRRREQAEKEAKAKARGEEAAKSAFQPMTGPQGKRYTERVSPEQQESLKQQGFELGRPSAQGTTVNVDTGDVRKAVDTEQQLISEAWELAKKSDMKNLRPLRQAVAAANEIRRSRGADTKLVIKEGKDAKGLLSGFMEKLGFRTAPGYPVVDEVPWDQGGGGRKVRTSPGSNWEKVR